ncbi:MAG TPA: GNAT family N-acetyltransferase [Actinomycetota bacterium]|nr:GNAT family N-acetyltransferase [Actinomycetota bacterium]
MATHEFSKADLHALRELLDEAFEGGFTDDDWDHTVGGLHVLAVENGIVSHAAVVERLLTAADRPLRAGYVEGVATALEHRGRGHSSTVMREIGQLIQAHFELGGLSTGLPDFYARLGWELWPGPTYTSSRRGPQRTAEDDGGVMVLRTGSTQHLETTLPLMCEWRSGDVW